MSRKEIKAACPWFPTEDLENILADIRDLLHSGCLLFGRFTEKFEQLFADYVGVSYAIGTNSGTSALEIALRCLGVKDGDEVIVPTNTFIASPNSVIFAGGRPVFADIDAETLCVDVEDAKERITDRTVGVMIVHVAGLITPQIEALTELCKDHNLFLVEDAAHAHGALFKDHVAGSLGDAGCFSFYSTKVLTAGEGGMICTNIPELANKSKILRHDGIGPDGLIAELGYNWHPSEFHSVLGIYQLARVEEFIRKRNEIAEEYEKRLSKISGVKLFTKPSFVRHSYYKFPVLVDGSIDAEGLIKTMQEKYGIEIGRVYYPPCHLQPLYKRMFGSRRGGLPVAEDVLKRTMCLPIHARMKTSDAEYVLESFERALSEC